MRSRGLVTRAIGMIMRPAAEWDIIDGEAATIQGLFTGYACILAAIPAVVIGIVSIFLISLIGLFSTFMPFITHWRTGWVPGRIVIDYIEWLTTVFVVGVIIDVLAPSFDGLKNPVQAMKLAVYSWTAFWVSAVLFFVPLFGQLIWFVAFFYSLYAFWIGAPKLMKTPAEKSSGYALICMAASFVAWLVIMIVFGKLREMLSFGAMMSGGLI